MSLRVSFGKCLKEKIKNNEDVSDIGHWAYSFYLEHIESIDEQFREVLLILNTMEDGPGFAFSYEELEKIADDLIAGKEVKIS